ncbi:ankyrin repeat domain-containing protein [Streptomyces misionensis]|uniref:ankyrin repeat domain-containing protein n=1 Tax=Streptomyces misionensis TaxID=67331 RepID=UPI003677A791
MREQRVTEWDGVTLRSSLKPRFAQARDLLADAARDGDWTAVGDVLAERPEWVNCPRLEGRSGYTPLHQAAWHGAGTATVEGLLARGASRTLRTGDGERAADIAARRGHHRLAELLRPVVRHPVPPAEIALLQEHLHRLIRHRAGLEGGSDLATRHALRLPEVEALTELAHPVCWFPVPGMYGGFRITLDGRELTVDSWIRIIGGSERTDRVTPAGVRLQEGEPLL